MNGDLSHMWPVRGSNLCHELKERCFHKSCSCILWRYACEICLFILWQIMLEYMTCNWCNIIFYSRVHVHNLHPGANLHPLASRSYANISYPYIPRFDLKFNTRYIVLWSNSLCLNVLRGDSDPLSLRVMCVRDISICGVWG